MGQRRQSYDGLRLCTVAGSQFLTCLVYPIASRNAVERLPANRREIGRVMLWFVIVKK